MNNTERAAEIGNIFCGNGLSHNQQIERVKALLDLWDEEAHHEERNAEALRDE